MIWLHLSPLIDHPQFLALCGAAYRPTEEIDLRSIGWGNIFQLPFKHLRDYRLRLLCPFFIYSGFEILFAVTGLMLVSGGGSCGSAEGQHSPFHTLNPSHCTPVLL